MLELAKVEAQIRRLHPLRRRKLFEAVKIYSEDTQITEGQALFLWTVDYVSSASAPFLLPEQQDLLFTTFVDFIVSCGDDLAKFFTTEESYEFSEIRPVNLMLADRKFAAITKSDKYLDLNTGEVLRSIGKAPLEVINYNLTKLLFWNMERLTKPLGDKNGSLEVLQNKGRS
jgi:hypothetical protein